jgi:hypothetical protein
MQNVIDVSNHILKYSQVYLCETDCTDLVRDEALELCYKYGEDFVLTFIENYLKLLSEEIT